MIKSLIVPLIFGTLVVGIAGHGDDMKRVGKLAFRSIVYFEIVTTLALVVGLLAVNIVKPGGGVSLAAATADKGTELAKTQVSFTSVVEHTVPQSFFESAAKNQVLQVVFFAILFAVALSKVQGRGQDSHARLLRVPRRGDVQVHGARDVVRAVRHRRRDRRHRGKERHRPCCATSRCSCCTLYGALPRVHSARARADRTSFKVPFSASGRRRRSRR